MTTCAPSLRIAKPRITCAPGEELSGWICSGRGVKGYGDSPAVAYGRWFGELIRRAEPQARPAKRNAWWLA
jgi:hypothetical protein